MATKSRIGINNINNGTRSIYCHYDGSLENNGRILLEHYTTEDKVNSLIDLGGISSLGKTVQIQDTDAYHRNRGEELEIRLDSSYHELEKAFEESDEKYCYIWEKGSWYFKQPGQDFSKLTDASIASSDAPREAKPEPELSPDVLNLLNELDIITNPSE